MGDDTHGTQVKPSLSDQMAASLDIIGEEEGQRPSEEVTELSAARRLLEYRQRTKHDMGDFIPLNGTGSSGDIKSGSASENFLVAQLSTSQVAAPTYWRTGEGTLGAKNYKKNKQKLVLKPGAKKAAKRAQKATDYHDRLKAKAHKNVARQAKRRGAK